MTLETRSRQRPAVYYQNAYSSPNFSEYYYANALGVLQQIDSVRTGTFIPGMFRANPVSIKKVSARSTWQPEPQKMWCKAPWAYAWYEYYGDVPGVMLTKFSDDLVKDNWGDQNGYLFNWSTKQSDIALTRAYAQVNEARFDAGVMLGELPETMEFIKKPLASLAPTLWSIRKSLSAKGSKKRARWMRSTLDSLTGTHLAVRYGVNPLVSDLKALYALIKEADDKIRVLNVNLQRVKRGSVVEQDLSSDSSWSMYLRHQHTIKRKLTRKTTAHLYFKVTGQLPTLAQFGLDLGNIPSVAWELFRLSFVWDWFINIGEWIKSLKTSITISMIGSVVSQKMTCATTVIHKYSTVENSDKYIPLEVEGLYGKPSNPTAERVTELLVRKVNLAKPLTPHILWAPLSLVRQIDALSLIWQSLPRRLR